MIVAGVIAAILLAQRGGGPTRETAEEKAGALTTGPCAASEARTAATAPVPLQWSVVWSAPATGLATSSPDVFSSPRNGVLVAVGAGRETVTGAVFLFDERGTLRWRTGVRDEVYTTPRFFQCEGSTPFVVAGGRINDVIALSVTDGSVVWSLRDRNPGAVTVDAHFNTATTTPDLDGDQCGDLVVIQSGGNDATRPPGHLMLVSGRSGALLADVQTHDGRELYAIPALLRSNLRDGAVELIVATGGETIPGGIARGYITAGDHGKLATDWQREITASAGIVASPLVVHEKRRARVVSVTFDGVVSVLDAEDGEIQWQARRNGYFAYSIPVVGRFGSEGVASVVTCVFNPARDRPQDEPGAVCDLRTLEAGQPVTSIAGDDLVISTPLVADVNRDGRDDLMLISVRSEPLPVGQGAPVGYDLVSTARFRVIDGRTWHELFELPVSGVTGGTPFLRRNSAESASVFVPFHNRLLRVDVSPSPGWIRTGHYRDRGGNICLDP